MAIIDIGCCCAYGKKAPKYQRYKQSAEYIRKHGYKEFLKVADGWKDASGKLP